MNIFIYEYFSSCLKVDLNKIKAERNLNVIDLNLVQKVREYKNFMSYFIKKNKS